MRRPRTPPSTWKREASPMPSNKRRFGGGHPHLTAAFEAAEQGRAAARIEMRGDLVEQQQGRRSAAFGDQLGMGEDQASSSAFCSPVEQRAAGMSLAAMGDCRSWRCGPSMARPAAASRPRLARSAGSEIAFGPAFERQRRRGRNRPREPLRGAHPARRRSGDGLRQSRRHARPCPLRAPPARRVRRARRSASSLLRARIAAS